MEEKKRSSVIGDVAVDGLISGVKAGLILAALLLGVGLIAGSSAVEAWVGLLARKGQTLFSAGLIHLAISGVYGVIFALGRYLVTGRRQHSLSMWATFLAGAAYGTVLYFLAGATLLHEYVPLSGLTLMTLYWIFGVTLAFLSRKSRLSYPTH